MAKFSNRGSYNMKTKKVLVELNPTYVKFLLESKLIRFDYNKTTKKTLLKTTARGELTITILTEISKGNQIVEKIKK